MTPQKADGKVVCWPRMVKWLPFKFPQECDGCVYADMCKQKETEKDGKYVG